MTTPRTTPVVPVAVTAVWRARLLALAEHVDGCTCSPYRVLYDQARAQYVDTVHPVECRRCGPSGKPAPAGSPRSLGHQEAMAYRRVAKTVLRDLWREARRLHGEGDGG